MRNESPVTNWEPPMSEKGLDESYAVIREALEKNNRGNVVNSLQNCVLALTQEEYAQWKSLGGEIHTALVTAVKAGADPAGPEGQRIAALHRRWLSYSWESYTPQAHVGLAELYVSDPRFTAYYDREVPGCAAFLRDAVRTYTGA